MKNDRRDFLKTAALAAGALAFPTVLQSGASAQQSVDSSAVYVGCNQYAFNSFLARDGIDFLKEPDKSFEMIKASGLSGFEPMAENAERVTFFGELLQPFGLGMQTLYTGINLHEEEAANAEINRVLALGEKAVTYGTKAVVFNLAPKSGKTDEELVLQSKNANLLGAGLKKFGLAFAFHYHTTELEFGGREFHHIMCGTDPENVSICFEMQWSYRASGNSAVAVYDHLKLYGNRASVIHLRQSQQGIWSETFGDGDIDCRRLAAGFKQFGVKPILIFEQAAENGTPHTLSAAEVFQKSGVYIRDIFGSL